MATGPPLVSFLSLETRAFMDMSGIERRHQIYEDIKLDFDKHMISNNVFNPIIVAEKDHKCYFISCWL